MSQPALIIYDGECIFCQHYVRFLRLRETVGPVELIDARSGDERVKQYARAGYDLNEGMLFVLDGRVYHGSDAVHVLATLSSPATAFNKVNSWLFRAPLVSRLVYPVLKLGRRATLFVRGRRLIARDAFD